MSFGVRRYKVSWRDTALTEALGLDGSSTIPLTRNFCITCSVARRRSTFEALPRWLQDVQSQASDNLVVVVVGNKTDLIGEDHEGTSSAEGDQAKREVTFEEAKAWADSQGLALVETSSLTGRNVEAPFNLCARSVLQLIEQGVVVPEERELCRDRAEQRLRERAQEKVLTSAWLHPTTEGSGVSYGDRGLRNGPSRSGSMSSQGNPGLSFADIVQSGGGVSRRAARGTGNGGGMIRVKEALGMERDGGCC